LAAKIIYYADGVTPTEYVFERGPQFGMRSSRIDLDSRKRTLDGSAYMDKGPTKGVWELSFIGIPKSQKDAFLAAYDSGYPLDFYLDSGAARTAEVLMSAPPDIETKDGFDESDEHTWDVSLILEET